MKLNAWYKKRGIRFIYERAKRLNQRYNVDAGKAIARIQHCLEVLEPYDCPPTFFVPAVVARRNLTFIRELQAQGCEIGVHGYQHVDMKSYSASDASSQLVHAAERFIDMGLEVYGFRCPYLSASDELLHELPKNLFKYSSNRAIQWSYRNQAVNVPQRFFETLQEFYLPLSAESNMSLPWMQEDMVEVPVCVPDDLQLYDGLDCTLEEISGLWSDLLQQTQQRGELFNLIFHPELSKLCDGPFVAVLKEARQAPNKVWVTRLRDISAWWREKETFSADIEKENGGYLLNFHRSHRGTLLYRGFEDQQPSTPWDKKYRRLRSLQMAVKGPVLPLIGLLPGTPEWVNSSLQRMGYLVASGENTQKCSLLIDSNFIERNNNPVLLIAHIESLDLPLIRFWPWPDGYRSALCLTGDLDALSLMDYATRLLPV